MQGGMASHPSLYRFTQKVALQAKPGGGRRVDH